MFANEKKKHRKKGAICQNSLERRRKEKVDEKDLSAGKKSFLLPRKNLGENFREKVFFLIDFEKVFLGSFIVSAVVDQVI